MVDPKDSILPAATHSGARKHLHNVLAGLGTSLEAFHGLLTEPETSSLIQKSLHNDTGLPDTLVLQASQRIVDLLGSIEHLLEPAALRLADHFLGYTSTKCLVAAVELNIPDHLSHGPLSLEELAERAKAKPQRLAQILRPLYTQNIFRYDGEAGCYSNNHVSDLLKTNHWTQWHNWVELYGNQFYDIAAGIPQAVRSECGARSAAQHVFNTDSNMFVHFQQQGWVPQLHRTLGGGATAMAPGILADYPWHELAHTTVLDIGGGAGAFIASLLRAHPTMKGGILELPGVVSHIGPMLEGNGPLADIAPRMKHVLAGDFLKQVPEFGAYTMKWVLHDWNDADAVLILRNVRSAIRSPSAAGEPESRMVVLESVLSETRSGRLSVYGDINMMMTANGQERTEAQWRSLAAEAGWVVHRIHPLRNAWVQAIDLRPIPVPLGGTAQDTARGLLPNTVTAHHLKTGNPSSADLAPSAGTAHDDTTSQVVTQPVFSDGSLATMASDQDSPTIETSKMTVSGLRTTCEKDLATTPPPSVVGVNHSKAALQLPEVVHGDIETNGRVVLYIIKADQTSYINYIKPLILALELNTPHILSVIDTKEDWYFSVHPQRMVPALKDRDPATGEPCVVFESTACLQYLCERFDASGSWSGRTAAEKGSIMAWTAYQTAALGPTAKYWLYFLRGYPNRQNPTPLPKTIEQLHKDTMRQWDILEKRLAEPGQGYVALKDRPTIADLSYLPFSMPYMFKLFSVQITDWPHIEAWSQAMLARPAVKAVLESAPTLGHDLETRQEA